MKRFLGLQYCYRQSETSNMGILHACIQPAGAEEVGLARLNGRSPGRWWAPGTFRGTTSRRCQRLRSSRFGMPYRDAVHVTSTVRPLFPHPPCFGTGLRGRDMCSFKVHVLTLSPKYMYLWTTPPSVFLAPVGLLDTLRALLVLVSLLYCRP
jgi:hypothetical protein